MNKWLKISSLLIALAIASSAFGAHYLKFRLDEYYLDVFNKASFYHLTQAMGMLLIAILGKLELLSVKNTKLILSILFFGILVFSGSLYLLAITQLKWLGAITPIGGVAMILAWTITTLSINKTN
jgi:uncharacterized membrane protein YgdD (TMEM256/DUF423 family)